MTMKNSSYSPEQTQLDSFAPFHLSAMLDGQPACLPFRPSRGSTVYPDKYHRELHERLVNTVSDIYMLPDDEEEDVRLQG